MVPCPKVLCLGWPIKYRQDVKVLFQGKGLEHELNPVLVVCGDGPRAVGIIGVAIREPWALHCPIGTLKLERAVLAWERERRKFSVARKLQVFPRAGSTVSKNHHFTEHFLWAALGTTPREGRPVTANTHMVRCVWLY